MFKLTSKIILINSNIKQQSTRLISTSVSLLSNDNTNDVSDQNKIKSTHTQVKGYELLRNPSLYKVS